MKKLFVFFSFLGLATIANAQVGTFQDVTFESISPDKPLNLFHAASLLVDGTVSDSIHKTNSSVTLFFTKKNCKLEMSKEIYVVYLDNLIRIKETLVKRMQQAPRPNDWEVYVMPSTYTPSLFQPQQRVNMYQPSHVPSSRPRH